MNFSASFSMLPNYSLKMRGKNVDSFPIKRASMWWVVAEPGVTFSTH